MDENSDNLQPAPRKEPTKKRIQRKPTAFERRVEARVTRNVAADLEQHHALTETGPEPPAEPAPVSGPESAQAGSPFAQALRLLRSTELASSPKALRLLADLAELAQGGEPAPSGRASHLIQPSGGGLPSPDLRREYERRLSALRPGDMAGLMDLKREFRKRGLEVY
jgi:hypothetical protein